ncbi:MAG: HPP family protein [Thauera sp.]|nr:HPP family protein [Thauera sp.]
MSLSRLFSLPAALSAGPRERVLGTLGVAVGLGCTEWIGYLALGGQLPWFIIPMGASAVLLFCVPASPLAQPWPSLAGNLVSALIGVGCYRWLGETGAAVALAGCLAVGAMFALRCLHPPGGAVALTAVLGGPLVHELGYGFALMPVLANTVAMLVIAFLFNNLVGRRYPHLAPTRPQPHDTVDPLPSKRVGFRAEDLDAALASFGEVLDVDRDDLEEIMVRAQMNARRRTWGALRCADIMSRDVVSVGPQASVDEAWALLAHHRIKALPVVEEGGRLVGIVSVPDFFIDRHNPEPKPVPRMSSARVVAEIMSARVRSARPGQSLADLVGAFSDGGLHHLPVADEDGRLVGMITQSDVVAALFAGERAG